MKVFTLEELTEKYIGKKGTPGRDAFDNELRMDLLGSAIKDTRKKRKLTQEQLGKLVGVQKAQISKIENSVKDVRFETVLKVFRAMNAQINFTVQLLDENQAIQPTI